MRNAAFAGFPLSMESMQAATRGMLNQMERVGLTGDTERSYRGLVNLTTGTGNVRLTTRASTFKAGTAEAMRDDINEYIGDLIENTEEVFGRTIRQGLCFMLPVEQFNYLHSKRVGDNLDRTIYESLTQANPWTARTGNPVNFQSLIELKDAAANGTDDRAIVVVKDPRVYEMGVSIMPRVITVRDMGRVMQAQLEAKFSPLFVKRPSTIHYIDNC